MTTCFSLCDRIVLIAKSSRQNDQSVASFALSSTIFTTQQIVASCQSCRQQRTWENMRAFRMCYSNNGIWLCRLKRWLNHAIIGAIIVPIVAQLMRSYNSDGGCTNCMLVNDDNQVLMNCFRINRINKTSDEFNEPKLNHIYCRFIRYCSNDRSTCWSTGQTLP